MLQKLTIDNLRSLTVAELGLVPAGSQDDSMLMAGALAAEFDNSCAYSNLLPLNLLYTGAYCVSFWQHTDETMNVLNWQH